MADSVHTSVTETPSSDESSSVDGSSATDRQASISDSWANRSYTDSGPHQPAGSSRSTVQFYALPRGSHRIDMAPAASVIVPAYDEPVFLSQCLSALRGQPAEVVVVASDAPTRQVADSHGACDIVVEDEGNGAGAARNRGVDASSGDVLLFTDADTTVPGGWVANHRRHYEDRAVVGVGGPARTLDGDAGDELLFRFFSDYWYRLSWPVGFVQLPTFNCSYRRSTFLGAGGFDETIPFMEDTELSMRLRDAGEFVYDTETRVATSARRESEQGYLSLLATYAKAYVLYYVLDREFDGEYFASE